MNSPASSPDPAPETVGALGIDVGGTKIAAGLVAFPGGRILAQDRVPTPTDTDGRGILARVEDLARQLAQRAKAERLRLVGLGIGLCEIVDRAGAIRSSNAIAWENVPVTERLRRIAPVTIEADVRAAALAEARLGAGRGLEVFVYVTIGTGVSCCLVQRGRPYLGARGAPGTMASSPLPVEVDALTPVTPPTFEDLGSGPGLVARFRQRGGQAQRAEDVLKAASSGDLNAIAVVRHGAQALGAAIGWLVNVLDPEAIVIGGGLGLTEGLYRDALVTSTRRHIWWSEHRQLPILSAATGRNAGLLGAAIAAMDRAARPAGDAAAGVP